MLRVLLVFLIGALLGWGVAGFVVPVPGGKERLFEEMGKIQPGMTLQQVEGALDRSLTTGANPEKAPEMTPVNASPKAIGASMACKPTWSPASGLICYSSPTTARNA